MSSLARLSDCAAVLVSTPFCFCSGRASLTVGPFWSFSAREFSRDRSVSRPRGLDGCSFDSEMLTAGQYEIRQAIAHRKTMILVHGERDPLVLCAPGYLSV